MSEGYHPEIDHSPLFTGDNIAKYRSIIGCCIWIIVLGRFYIAYATSVEMSSLLRTDPEVYNDKKQKHLKRFHSKVVNKIELN
jgi:hypothetical protein